MFQDWTADDARKAWDRLVQGIEVDRSTGCWIWTEDSPFRPYGQVNLPKAGSWFVHRFTYVWTFGGTPDKRQMDHDCVNPPCCNPLHLKPVTATTNSRWRNKRASDPTAEWALHDAEGVPLVDEVPSRLLMVSILYGLPLHPAESRRSLTAGVVDRSDVLVTAE